MFIYLFAFMQIKAVAAAAVVSETNPFLPPKIVNKSNLYDDDLGGNNQRVCKQTLFSLMVSGHFKTNSPTLIYYAKGGTLFMLIRAYSIIIYGKVVFKPICIIWELARRIINQIDYDDTQRREFLKVRNSN